ncbi:MAG: thiamine phosphate synthase [Calditrichota bacterium]
MNINPVAWRLFVLTDEVLSGGRSHVEVAQAALAGGAKVIQLRDKQASSRKLLDCALKIRELTTATQAVFIVNDRLDIALASEADGLHVGQDDLPAQVARKLLGSKKILGVSARSVKEAIQAECDGADYIGLGPVFEARGTKVNAGEPLGLELIRAVRRIVKIPIIAIGGINRDNAAEVIQAGATGVAVISAVVGAADIKAATAEIKRIITR